MLAGIDSQDNGILCASSHVQILEQAQKVDTSQAGNAQIAQSNEISNQNTWKAHLMVSGL